MGLKTFTIDFSEFSGETSNRFDVNFIDFNKIAKQSTYSFGEFFDIQNFEKKDRLSLLEDIDGDFYYAEIGNSTKQGDVIPEKLNLDNRNELVADYFKKIDKGDIQKAEKGNILLAKVRPNLKKYILIDEEKEKYFYTTAFINLKPKKLGKILYYLLRTVFYENLMAISRQGKGYPTLKENDLLTLRFNKNIIDNLEKNQKQIISQIKPIEKNIKKLKSQIKEPQEIINKVFAREFKLDLKKVEIADKSKYFSVDNNVSFRNANLRSSVRWHKIEPIQKTMYANNPYIKKLGRFILSTKNGWSPNCKESDSEYCVLGVNSISKNGNINFQDLKFSNENKENIEDFYSKEGDLFVSRGNTTDLVALASVLGALPDEQHYIFPDLFIKVELNEKKLNKNYLAYLFNSIIGRLYFKNSAKGKNQTMVKISAEELSNFYMPIPPLKIQQRIVDEIKVELDNQEVYEKKIESERDKIDDLIEKSIK
jgi:type I restriction enzyme, S subunit